MADNAPSGGHQFLRSALEGGQLQKMLANALPSGYAGDIGISLSIHTNPEDIANQIRGIVQKSLEDTANSLKDAIENKLAKPQNMDPAQAAAEPSAPSSAPQAPTPASPPAPEPSAEPQPQEQEDTAPDADLSAPDAAQDAAPSPAFDPGGQPAGAATGAAPQQPEAPGQQPAASGASAPQEPASGRPEQPGQGEAPEQTGAPGQEKEQTPDTAQAPGQKGTAPGGAEKTGGAGQQPGEPAPEEQTASPDGQKNGILADEAPPSDIPGGPAVSSPEEAKKNKADAPKPDSARSRDAARRARFNQKRRHAQNIRRGTFDVNKFLDDNKVDLSNTLQNATDASSLGTALGQELSKRIKQGQFHAFLIAILLALTKDTWDMIESFIDLNLVGSIFLNTVISVALWIVLSANAGFISRNIKKWIIRLVLGMILEFIPIINFIPTYTVLIILLKRAVDKERRHHVSAYENLQTQLKKAQ